VKGYSQYCPIALAAEVFAERWTPVILRNMMLGCTRFGEILDGAPGLPRSVLSARLRSLQHDGVVRREQDGRATSYHLTDSGRELAAICTNLGVWGTRWREAPPEHRDPALMLWGLARLVAPGSLPQPRVVARFDITDKRAPNRFWLIASFSGNEVCVHPPGFDEHAVVTTDTNTLMRWQGGQYSLAQAQKSGAMNVTGVRWAIRELARWGTLSPFAGIQPVRVGR
jgi:DNA-binding HxlR family transcriptional regulator